MAMKIDQNYTKIFGLGCDVPSTNPPIHLWSFMIMFHPFSDMGAWIHLKTVAQRIPNGH